MPRLLGALRDFVFGRTDTGPFYGDFRIEIRNVSRPGKRTEFEVRYFCDEIDIFPRDAGMSPVPHTT